MSLELTDFDRAGLNVDALGLFVAGAAPDLYLDADRGGTQSPESGELGIGAGETRIAGVRLISNNRIALLDSNLPAALSLSDWFGSSGTSVWTLHLQTDDGTVSSDQIDSAGSDVVRWQFTHPDAAAVLNGIASGDRVIIGVAKPTLPVAASFDAAALAAAAAVGKIEPARLPVAASFAGAALAASVAVARREMPREPRAVLAASETTIEQGRAVELRWATSDAASAEIDNGIGPVPLQGSVRVRPERAATYTLTAFSFAGAPGTTPATASVTVGVTPRQPRSLLPPNATPLERALERAADREIDVPIRKLWSAADCPAALLPYLAWALGVEDWDSDWPEPLKRAAVAAAFRIHREKGTLAGLRRLLENAGAEYEYTERPAGQPMTAKLSILNSNAVYLPDIAAAIGRVKRASLHLDIELLSAAAGQIPIAGGLGAATFVEISDWGPHAV